MQPFLDMVQRLKTELTESRTIEQNFTQTSPTSHLKGANHLNPDDFPALSSQPPPWHYPELVAQIKRNLAEHEQQRRLQRQEAAACLLQPLSKSQGFKYIYMPTKLRAHIIQIQTCLKKLDINNKRTLDMHHLDRHVAALLVHGDCVSEIRAQLECFKVILNDDFDLCDPKVLGGPKYAGNSSHKRANYAFMHHSDRMARTLRYIRAPAKYAVNRFFYSKRWISKALPQDTLPSKSSTFVQAADLFTEDVNMDNAGDLFHNANNTYADTTKDTNTIGSHASLWIRQRSLSSMSLACLDIPLHLFSKQPNPQLFF
ncbi:unnamed protein product [Rhizopus microsporus]